MIVGVERYRQFIMSTFFAAALSLALIQLGRAQTQDATAHEQSPAENNSAAEASKQAALAEYRHASELDPGNKQFHAVYERLAKELKK